MEKHILKKVANIIVIAVLAIVLFCGCNVTSSDGPQSGIEANLPTENNISLNEGQAYDVSKSAETAKKTDSLQNTPLHEDEHSGEIHTGNDIADKSRIVETSVEDFLTENTSEAPPAETTEQVDSEPSEKELTCVLSVRCDSILDNLSDFDDKKVDILPDDGIIFAEKSVTFYEGESVFNVLSREMKKNKIHMEFEMSPLFETAYIKGIANIYEFDCGELSGWLYKVNNESPGVGCSIYQLKDGDRIEWIYTCG